jgi:transposase
MGEQREFFESSGQERPSRRALREDAELGIRVRRAERGQVSFSQELDQLIPVDHPARAIWDVVEKLNLAALYSAIESRGSNAGAPAIDPKIPLVVWIYAMSEGVGSAREIAELCRRHDAYRWICGGVKVGAHHLSDFRVENGAVFGDLITQVLAVLLKHKVLDLSRVAQDGTRIRASAGAASFRRRETLEQLQTKALAHLKAVLAEAEDSPLMARRAAARERVARERVDRVKAALVAVEEQEKIKRLRKNPNPARASTTDPDARVMKMADGGFRPAYNVQFATTTDAARAIVGVSVVNRGTDAGESSPMLAQIDERTGQQPAQLLVDGGYVQEKAIEEAAADGTELVAPLRPQIKPELRKPGEPARDDSKAIAKWRKSMDTPATKELYRLRAATAETVNADLKTHRALDEITVRGLPKILCVASLAALTYNILRLLSVTA